MQTNNRQMPKLKEDVSKKTYCDLVYAYLQVNSIWDVETDIRYINKSCAKFVTIAEATGMTRQTASTKVKYLLEAQLLIDDKENNRYILPLLMNNRAMLIDVNTLRKMVSVFNERAISLYIYLFNMFYANKEQMYKATMTQLKGFLGLSTKTYSNDYLIKDILEILSMLGLVLYKIQISETIEGYKTEIVIQQVKNKIDESVLKMNVGREVNKMSC